ncbi:MAG: hypothetical protein JO168_20435 [Solirubrobacterales bacterium]|nr:hypothetical protein [Solirubrobacterales bacterium]
MNRALVASGTLVIVDAPQHPPEVTVTAVHFSELFAGLWACGRSGWADERGARNSVTCERVAAATRLVRNGVTVTFSLPLNTDPALRNPVPADHHMTAQEDPDGADDPVDFEKDYVGLGIHNDDGDSHVDALCHVAYRGVLYHDRPERSLAADGAVVMSVEVIDDRLVGRRVRLDIPRPRGLLWLQPGDYELAEHLEAAGRATR